MTIRLAVFLVIFLSYSLFPHKDVNTVDDKKLLNELVNIKEIDISNIFIPSNPVYYYRPITMLTFYLDQRAHFADPGLMHLENIIIHSANAIFVSILARCFVSTPLAIVSACLFFGLNPINTEAVNWISARTDLLATFFVLLSVICFFRYLNLWSSYILIGILVLCGLMSKESSAGYVILLAVTIWWLFPKISLEKRLGFSIVLAIVVIFYLMFRCPQFRFWSGDFQPLTVSSVVPYIGRYEVEGSLWYQIGVFFKVVGFYFKKILIPWPLNFCIVEINRTFYLIFGIVVFTIIILLLIKERGPISFSLFWVVCFVFPSVFVPLRKLAWTPLAERYVYTASVGMAVAVALILERILKNVLLVGRKRIMFYSALATIFVVFLISTMYRNYVWQDNERLYGDAIAKSPNFPPAHNEYAIALLMKGKKEEALKHFEIATNLSKGFPNHISRLNELLMKQENLTPEEVISEYEVIISETENTKDILIKAIRYIESYLLNSDPDDDKRNFLLNKEYEMYKRLIKIDKDPFWYYRTGQILITMGKRKEALQYFKQSYQLAEDGVYYKEAAKKIFLKLSTELGEVDNNI